MEDLIGLIVSVVIIIASVVSKASKGKRPAKTGGHPYARPQEAPPASAKPVPAVPAKPVPVPAAVAVPTVAATVAAAAPIVSGIAAASPESAEGKSLPQRKSQEGVDPCHEEMLPPAVKPAAASSSLHVEEEHPGLTLEWSGEALVKAFVMQEVLKRPCERRAGRAG